MMSPAIKWRLQYLLFEQSLNRVQGPSMGERLTGVAWKDFFRGSINRLQDEGHIASPPAQVTVKGGR